MKKSILIGIAITVLAVAVLGVAGLAFAQAQTPPPPDQPFGPGMMRRGGSGFGMMGRGGASNYGPMHPYMVAAFAEALGFTPEDLQAKLDSGESMWTVAQTQGLSEEEFTNLMLEARTEAAKQAVADGALTQEQADWMSQRMQQMQNGGFGPGNCPMHGGGFGQAVR